MEYSDKELIYRQNIFLRTALFFFYYWTILLALLFLPLCLTGTVYFGWQIIHSFASPVPSPAYGKFDNWLTVIIGVVASWWIISRCITGFKNFIKPVRTIEGIIIEKEEREFDEGKCYYLHLRPELKIEINEQSFRRLNRGNRIIISYSNKLDTALSIVRVA